MHALFGVVLGLLAPGGPWTSCSYQRSGTGRRRRSASNRGVALVLALRQLRRSSSRRYGEDGRAGAPSG